MNSLAPRPSNSRRCPCCNDPSYFGICTGMAGALSPTDSLAVVLLAKRGISPESGALRLAEHLGLTETGFTLIPFEKGLEATEELRELWSTLMPGEVEDNSHPILGFFCARYLPSLVSAYKANPRVDNPYHAMLVGVSQSLYFAKFLRCPIGSDLYAFYVAQVLKPPYCLCAEDHRTYHASMSIVGLLILATYAHEYKARMQQLSEEVEAQLTEWLSDTAQDALAEHHSGGKDKPLRIFNSAMVIIDILRGQLKSDALHLTLTRRLTFDRYAAKHDTDTDADTEGTSEAGTVTKPKPKMTRRFECARCQTVAYCCRVHQKEDWRWHKTRCFETTY
ncbi:hypothetical protein C8R47DRAFT_1158631 [Mycena vitilis]|nr:hypothetical protein C8R47DRAFT_1158631 [Mycena vitilis]